MAEVGRNADNDEKCIYMKMPTIIQLTKAIMKMKTDNAHRPKDIWARIDVNGNGYVSLAEITKVLYQLHNYHHNQIE